MTFDGSQGVYFGPATMDAGSATVSLSNSAGSGEHAACATVLDGAGAGQYRKIVGWSKGTNQTNQTITLDKPFATPVDETSTIQLGTCHMMILMHDNYYADGGAVQMIGDGECLFWFTSSMRSIIGFAERWSAAQDKTLLYRRRSSSAPRGSTHGAARLERAITPRTAACSFWVILLLRATTCERASSLAGRLLLQLFFSAAVSLQW